MKIRLAASQDIPALAQMRWDFKIETKPSRAANDKPAFLNNYCDFLITHLQDPMIKTWVAEEDNQLVAQVQLQICPQLPAPGNWNRALGIVSNVYTQPTHRGRGIARQILTTLIDDCKNNQVYKLELVPRTEAISLYQAVGFDWANNIMSLKLTVQN